MTQFNDTELTAAVIHSFEEVKNPRVKFLMEELVKSLHAFVRKTDLPFGEWEYAIDFLTRVGQKGTPSRQEFILLSDVLGVSMLVDAVNHRERDGATETTVLGPFYVGEHKVTPHGTDVSANLPGERMFVQSRVPDLNGKRWAAGPAPSDAAGARALPGQRAGLSAADHARLHGWRQVSGFRRGVRGQG